MARRKKEELASEETSDAASAATSAHPEVPPETKPKRARTKKKQEQELPPIDQSLLLTPLETSVKEKKESNIAAKTQNGSEKPAQRGKNVIPADNNRQVRESTVPLHFPEVEKQNAGKALLALILLVAVIVTSVCIFLFRPDRYDERTHSVSFFYAPETGETVIAVDGRTRGCVTGEMSHYEYNSDGSICAAIIGDSLYAIKGKKIVCVATDVQDCVLSANGKVLAWRGMDQVLYYTEWKSGDIPSPIARNVTDPHYALSPNGKEMFYTYTNTETGELHASVYSRTDTAPYMQNPVGMYPVAVADKCKYLYYIDTEGVLYMVVGKTGEKIACGKEPQLDSVIFNRDCSQLIFRNGSETRVFAGGKQIRVPDISVNDTLQLMANQRVSVRRLRVGTQYLTKTLFDNYYLLYTGSGIRLIYLEKKKDQATVSPVSFVDGAHAVTVTDKAVYFLSTSVEGSTPRTKLFCCRAGKTASELLAWDVTAFCANVDGSRILYTDLQGALYGRKLKSAAERLCDSILVDTLTVTANDAFYFYSAEGVLMVSDNGDAPRVIREGVNAFVTDADTLYFMTDRDESGVGTVHAIHRNRRRERMIAERVR